MLGSGIVVDSDTECGFSHGWKSCVAAVETVEF
jgi:hypothetical protein